MHSSRCNGDANSCCKSPGDVSQSIEGVVSPGSRVNEAQHSRSSIVIECRQAILEERKDAGMSPTMKRIRVEIEWADVRVLLVMNNESLKDCIVRADAPSILKSDVLPTSNGLDIGDCFTSLWRRKMEVVVRQPVFVEYWFVAVISLLLSVVLKANSGARLLLFQLLEGTP